MKPQSLKRAVALALLAAPPAMAEETRVLPTITVTAPEAGKAQFQVPYSTSVVDGERASNELQTKTLPEALRYEPGVMIQQTGAGQYSPYIRGLTGYRTLLMVDGIRVNNAAMRDGPNQYWGTVDPLMIDSYELIRGPSSSLYGSDAVAGTLNVKTQGWQPREDGRKWGGRAYYRYGQADNSNIGRVEFGGQSGPYDLWFGASGKAFNNLTTGNGQTNPHTDYDQESVNAKARYHIDNEDTLTFAYQYDTQNDVWRTQSTVHQIPFNGSATGSNLARPLNQRRQLGYLRYEGSNLGAIDALALTFSYQQMEEEERVVSANGASQTNNFKDDTLGFQVRASSQTAVGLLDYGLEYYHDDIDSNGNRYDAKGVLTQVKRQGTVANGSSYDQVGLYLQDTYILGDFELTGGGRFNYVNAHLGQGTDAATGRNADNFNNDWANGVGNGRILYHLNKEWNVYASVAQGWRAPSVYDLSGQGLNRSGEVQAYSLKLRPEDFITYEAGVKAQYGQFDASAAYYYNDIDNMVVRAPVADPAKPGQALKFNGSTVVEARNSGQGHIQGVELAGRYHFDESWAAFANFTWTDSSVLDYPGTSQRLADTPVTRMIPINGTFGLRWDGPGRQFWAEGMVTAVAQQTRLSFSDQRDTQRIPPGGTPGYTLLALRGGWNPAAVKDLRASVALENLLDEKYRVHGSGINGPGRQVVMTLDYRF